MIEVKQVSKNFGPVKAVDNVSFSVAAGETLILLGTSGCGKTTTLRMLNKLEEPSAGIITFNNQPISEIPPEQLRRRMGYVLQHTGLFPHYTVAENMAIVPRLLKWESRRIQDRAIELLHKLHLSEEYLTLYPDQLSGGQQQRVGLARALMADPPVLLLDEPFGALDPITRVHIRQEFLHLDELKRKTVIMVTHDITEAFELGDRICLMQQGRIEQMGLPKELLFQPKSDFVRSFLKEQQLPLELKNVTLAEIGIAGIQNVPASGSVWDALALLLPPPNSSDFTPPTNEKTTNKNPPAANAPEINQLLKALQNFRKS
ncbi:glycine/betaine ABC transporter ATP-binding protein [Adhaeribacter arboris]|uniref:Glycine/betaine ABC transporter ATP-binding protein n=1 Tax=Adhaeribacter arboris TaxID=2072846 RepID=A0A2T2YLI4_9BACT|nr:ABC transporter ATP-binding protein [Adhaeribacter arboris]PSR56360.1 glycine/betaine ABC transporter ATP-binding protein [Adhaeribacter arboris]